MISINLVPDVKQELIRAQRVRSAVISLAIVAGIIVIAVVVVLSVYVFAVQTVRSSLADNSIKSESKTLSDVPDLSDALTCLLYTSDAADEEDSVDLGGRRIIKK